MNNIELRTIPALAVLIALGIATTVRAAEFCATNSAELQQHLATAANNGEDDVIRIAAGTYPAPGGTFLYDGAISEEYNLTLIGGYTEFFGNPSALRIFRVINNALVRGHASAAGGAVVSDKCRRASSPQVRLGDDRPWGPSGGIGWNGPSHPTPPATTDRGDGGNVARMEAEGRNPGYTHLASRVVVPLAGSGARRLAPRQPRPKSGIEFSARTTIKPSIK